MDYEHYIVVGVVVAVVFVIILLVSQLLGWNGFVSGDNDEPGAFPSTQGDMIILEGKVDVPPASKLMINGDLMRGFSFKYKRGKSVAYCVPLGASLKISRVNIGIDYGDSPGEDAAGSYKFTIYSCGQAVRSGVAAIEIN